MVKHDGTYKANQCIYRSDGMVVYLPTRSVYIDKFTKLSSCMFERCPFYGLTCDKCHYCVL